MDQACPLCQVDNINSSNSHFAFSEILYSEFLFVLLRPFIKETVFHKSFDCPCSYAESLAQDRILVYPFYETNTLTLYSGIILFCTSALLTPVPATHQTARSINPSLPVINSSASSSTPTQFEKLVNNFLKF